MVNKFVMAIVAIATTVGMVGLIQTTSVAANSQGKQNPGGNNGTLKVHEQGTVSGTESNDPKVCVFNFEGFGFDVGQTGTIEITVQGGSQPIGENAGPFPAGPADQNGYFATIYFNDGVGPTIKNGTYKATMYGKQLPSGQLEEKAKSKVFKVSCEDEEPEQPQPVADLSFSYVCDVRTQMFNLTLTNRGDAAGDVTLNGDQVTVPANDSRDLSLPAGRDGAKVTLVIDGKTELNQTFYCIAGRGAGGMGGSTPTTPVTVIPGKGAAGDVVSLPVTSGASDQLAALVVMSMGALTAIGGYVLRSRSGELSL